MTETLSPALARRIALAAQGFGRARPEEVVAGHLGRLVPGFGRLDPDIGEARRILESVVHRPKCRVDLVRFKETRDKCTKVLSPVSFAPS